MGWIILPKIIYLRGLIFFQKCLIFRIRGFRRLKSRRRDQVLLRESIKTQFGVFFHFSNFKKWKQIKSVIFHTSNLFSGNRHWVVVVVSFCVHLLSVFPERQMRFILLHSSRPVDQSLFPGLGRFIIPIFAGSSSALLYRIHCYY